MQSTQKLGGIIVYIRKEIARGVIKLDTSSTEAIWMKLEKRCFGLFKVIYLCAQYIAPRNSPLYTVSEDGQDRHDQLSNDIDIYSVLGDVAIIGDLNSRVGPQQETLMILILTPTMEISPNLPM